MFLRPLENQSLDGRIMIMIIIMIIIHILKKWDVDWINLTRESVQERDFMDTAFLLDLRMHGRPNHRSYCKVRRNGFVPWVFCV
jgi:hypothetical protein